LVVGKLSTRFSPKIFLMGFKNDENTYEIVHILNFKKKFFLEKDA
jgi:hypothetical protein